MAKKCVPCLRDLSAFINQSGYLEVYLSKKDKEMASYHGLMVEGTIRGAETNECFPKDLMDTVIGHTREMRVSIKKEDWADAEWRLKTIKRLLTEPGLSWIIDHCEKETGV